MANVQNVAAAVFEQLGPMTAMKLQKIIYYCQSWHLARENRKLFTDAIQAWRQGPVVRSIWAKHRGMYQVHSWPDGDPTRLTAIEARTVKWVCDRYGDFTPIELSRMTHSEVPWMLARGSLPESETSSAEISCDVMANFYARQIADPESSTSHAIASAALEGFEFDTEWQEKLRDVASGSIGADQVIAEEVARITNG